MLFIHRVKDELGLDVPTVLTELVLDSKILVLVDFGRTVGTIISATRSNSVKPKE